MSIAQILKTKGNAVISINKDFPIIDGIKVMSEKRIGAVLVRNDAGEICGVLSERDIVRELAVSGKDLMDMPVSSIMTKEIFTCTSDQSVNEAMAIMTAKRFRHLPVVDDGELVGMISIGDVVKKRIAESENEAEALKLYIAG
jgi:CBS domain-containing protein